MIAVVIPVLDRPGRVAPLMSNIAATTTVPYRLLFVASRSDDAEIVALKHARADFVINHQRVGRGNYAKKINQGYRETDEPYIFAGADDLLFHPGWAEAALQKFCDGIGVVGTNDLGNARVMRGEHSTHSLVSRSYADELGTIDGPGAIYAECYHHQFCDDELVGTAKMRGAWAFASDSHVEHMHPYCRDRRGKPKAEMDATYQRGLSTTRTDSQLFRKRRVRWR